MWVDERRTSDQRGVIVQRAGHRMHRGDLQCLFVIQRGQHPRQPRRQHRLAGPRRTDHRQVVPTRRGELQRQPGLRLTKDISKIRTGSQTQRAGSNSSDQRLQLPLQARHQIAETCHTPHRHPGCQRRFGKIRRRYDRLFTTDGPSREQGRQHPPYRPHLPVQSELADQHGIPGRLPRNHPGSRENSYGQGDVIPRTTFRQRRRGQRQGDPPIWPSLPGIHHRRSDAVPCLGDRSISHPDHRRPRQTLRQIGLHRNQVPRDTAQRHRPRPRQCHAPTLLARQPSPRRENRMWMENGHGNKPTGSVGRVTDAECDSAAGEKHRCGPNRGGFVLDLPASYSATPANQHPSPDEPLTARPVGARRPPARSLDGHCPTSDTRRRRVDT